MPRQTWASNVMCPHSRGCTHQKLKVLLGLAEAGLLEEQSGAALASLGQSKAEEATRELPSEDTQADLISLRHQEEK